MSPTPDKSLPKYDGHVWAIRWESTKAQGWALHRDLGEPFGLSGVVDGSPARFTWGEAQKTADRAKQSTTPMKMRIVPHPDLEAQESLWAKEPDDSATWAVRWRVPEGAQVAYPLTQTSSGWYCWDKARARAAFFMEGCAAPSDSRERRPSKLPGKVE